MVVVAVACRWRGGGARTHVVFAALVLGVRAVVVAGVVPRWWYAGSLEAHEGAGEHVVPVLVAGDDPGVGHPDSGQRPVDAAAAGALLVGDLVAPHDAQSGPAEGRVAVPPVVVAREAGRGCSAGDSEPAEAGKWRVVSGAVVLEEHRCARGQADAGEAEDRVMGAEAGHELHELVATGPAGVAAGLVGPHEADDLVELGRQCVAVGDGQRALGLAGVVVVGEAARLPVVHVATETL